MLIFKPVLEGEGRKVYQPQWSFLEAKDNLQMNSSFLICGFLLLHNVPFCARGVIVLNKVIWKAKEGLFSSRRATHPHTALSFHLSHFSCGSKKKKSLHFPLFSKTGCWKRGQQFLCWWGSGQSQQCLALCPLWLWDRVWCRVVTVSRVIPRNI